MMRTYRDIAKEMLELRDMVRELTEERDTLRATVAKLEQERDKLQKEIDRWRSHDWEGKIIEAVTAGQEQLRENDQLRAQLAERDEQIAALREYVSDWRDEIYCSPSSTEQREVVKQNFLAKMDGVLTGTAQAAAAHDERIKDPLEAQVAALMSYVRWLDNHGSLEIEADDAETMLERYSVAEIKYKDEQQTRFMQGNTAAAAEAHDAGVRRRATAAVKSVRDEAVKLADHHCVVQVLRWLDRAIAALSTAGKEET